MVILLFLTAILLIVLSHKLIRRSNPIYFFSLMWIGQIILACLLFNKMNFSFWGLEYIEIAITFTIAGATIIQIYQPKTSVKPRRQINVKTAKVIVFFLLVVAFIQPIQAIHEYGGISILLSLDDLLETNNAVSADRYGGGVTERGMFYSIMLSITYVAPLFAGYAYKKLDKFGKRLAILCILPGIFQALTQGVKMGLITSVILCFGGYMTYIIYHHISLPRLSFKLLLKGVSILALFFSILFLSMMFRTGKLNEDIFGVIQHKFAGYAIEHLSAFDQWFSNMPDPVNTYGGTFFAGITNFLGIIERKQGLYQEFYSIWKDDVGSTNVFTLFRIIIDDFGYLGSIFFWFFFGAITTIICKNVRANINSLLSQVLLMIIWALILWSFVTSFLAYTSYILMFVIMYGLLNISTTIRSDETET